MALSNLHFFPPHSAPPPALKTARGPASPAPRASSPGLSIFRYLRVLYYPSSATFRASAASILAQNARLPAARRSSCAPVSADGRPWFRLGVTRPQKRGRGGVWGGVLCRSQQNFTNVGGDAYDEDDFSRRLRLVTSRVLVADASPSGGGRGQLRRSPFPSLMRLRHPGV